MYGINVRHKILVLPVVALLLVSGLVLSRARESQAMALWDIETIYQGAPRGMTSDGYGNLYIADGGKILRKDAQTGVVTEVVSSGLEVVDDLEVDGAGHLYLFERPAITLESTPPARHVKKVNRDTLAVTDVLGEIYVPAGFGQTEGTGPSAFGVAANGDIYIALSNRVLRFPAGSNAATTPTVIAGSGIPAPNNFDDINSAGATPLNNRLGEINDIALHPTTGDVYFSDSRGAVLRVSNGALQLYASGGGVKTRATPGPNDPPQPIVQSPAGNFDLSGPVDLAFDSAGQLFVVEQLRNSVLRISADGGSFQQMIGDAGGQGFSGDLGPAWDAELFIESEGGGFADLAVAGGNALLLDGGNGRIRSTFGIATGGNVRGPGPGTPIPPPPADFEPPATVIAGQPATFTDTSNAPASWLWNFGDGTTSTDQNPTHVFASAGPYSVQLTVVSALTGQSASVTKGITATADPNPPTPGAYVPVTPFRVLETRAPEGLVGVVTAGPVGPGAEIVLDVSGPLGQTAAGLDAVVLNLTAIQPTSGTFVTVYPDGVSKPLASNLNVSAGRILPNLVITKVGSNGKVRIFNSGGNTQFVADIMGYFPSASSYESLTPARVLDTREEGPPVGVPMPGPVGANTRIVLDLDGKGGLPTSGIGSVVLNVTATDPTSATYVTVYPASEATTPKASNLNVEAKETAANLVVVTPDANGEVAFYNAAGDTDVIADVVGYFPTGSTTFTGFSPVRVLETRAGEGPVGVPSVGAVGPGGEVDLQVLGVGGVPASGVGAVIINVTATQITGGSYVTVYPGGAARPVASNLNLELNDTVPNLVIAKVGANGKIKLYNNSNSTALIGDVVGYLPA